MEEDGKPEKKAKKAKKEKKEKKAKKEKEIKNNIGTVEDDYQNVQPIMSFNDLLGDDAEESPDELPLVEDLFEDNPVEEHEEHEELEEHEEYGELVEEPDDEESEEVYEPKKPIQKLANRPSIMDEIKN